MQYTSDQIDSGVDGRRSVDQCVRNTPDKALAIAEAIEHHWYRCQALASIAIHIDSERVEMVIHSSVQAALLGHDENRRVSMLVWPLEACLIRKVDSIANFVLEKIMVELDKPMDPVSRWCAVDVVHVIKTRPQMMKKFFPTFKNSTSRGHGWRIEKSLKWMINDHEVSQYADYAHYVRDRYKAIEYWKINNRKCNKTII